MPLVYEGMHIDKGYRADIIVAGTVLLELKAVEHLLPVREAQTLTYLRLSGCATALLMNFNTVLLKQGLRRFVVRPALPLESDGSATHAPNPS